MSGVSEMSRLTGVAWKLRALTVLILALAVLAAFFAVGVMDGGVAGWGSALALLIVTVFLADAAVWLGST